MRAVFYTHTAYFESASSLVRALSSRVELHVLMEVAPQAWQLAAFDVQPTRFPGPIISAEQLLQDGMLSEAQSFWREAASFNFVVHTAHRFYEPAALRVSQSVLELVRDLQPAVVHFDSAPLRFGLLSGFWPRARYVISEHDPRPHIGEADWRLRVARAFTYPRMHHFILHSRAGLPEFARDYHVNADRVSVVPLGPLHLMRLWAKPDVQPTANEILFFGRLSPYKGLDVLYAAAQAAAREIANLHVVVAGRPIGRYVPPRPPRLANGGSIETIEQYVPNSHLVALCQKASVVVCPYVEASQSAVLLTAFALGTPVIATSTGGLPEYIQDNETGVLVPPDDPRALAHAIERVLTDAPFRARLSANVRSMSVSNDAWERAADMIVSTYRMPAR